MSSNPLFSVCLLAHNNAGFIRKAIESVLSQNEPDWELIIADDASHDETEEIVKTYLPNPKISYLRHKINIGQAANWWSAIQNAKGCIVTTLHADDAYHPEALTIFRNAFDQPAVELVWARWWRCDADLQPVAIMPDLGGAREFTGLEACKWLVKNNHALPSACAFRSSLAKKTGSPDPRLPAFCDADYFLRLSLNAVMCRSLATPVTWYRVHDAGMTTDFGRTGKFRDEFIAFPQIAASYLSNQQGILNEIKEFCAKEVFRQGTLFILSGKSTEGRAIWKQARKISPNAGGTAKELCDRILIFFGFVGIAIARYLHKDRLNSYK